MIVAPCHPSHHQCSNFTHKQSSKNDKIGTFRKEINWPRNVSGSHYDLFGSCWGHFFEEKLYELRPSKQKLSILFFLWNSLWDHVSITRCNLHLYMIEVKHIVLKKPFQFWVSRLEQRTFSIDGRKRQVIGTKNSFFFTFIQGSLKNRL